MASGGPLMYDFNLQMHISTQELLCLTTFHQNMSDKRLQVNLVYTYRQPQPGTYDSHQLCHTVTDSHSGKIDPTASILSRQVTE